MKQTRNLEDLLRQYDLLAAPAARDAAVTGICNDSPPGPGRRPLYLQGLRLQAGVSGHGPEPGGRVRPGGDGLSRGGHPLHPVTDVRKAQSLAARWFYDNPSDGLTLIGVTGTKGKTTTSYMIPGRHHSPGGPDHGPQLLRRTLLAAARTWTPI